MPSKRVNRRDLTLHNLGPVRALEIIVKNLSKEVRRIRVRVAEIERRVTERP